MLLQEPNSPGRSRHGEPVRQSQRTALMTRRWDMDGLPAVVRFSGGNKGLRMAHCSSVSEWRGGIGNGMHLQIRTAPLQTPSNFWSYLRTQPSLLGVGASACIRRIVARGAKTTLAESPCMVEISGSAALRGFREDGGVTTARWREIKFRSADVVRVIAMRRAFGD